MKKLIPNELAIEREFSMGTVNKKEHHLEKSSAKKSFSDKEREIEELLSSHKTKIKVIGCGGAGNNTLSRLLDSGISDVVSIAVNTDAQDLLYAQADQKILIGREITNGLGAGSIPEIGEHAARESEEEINRHLEGADLVFVTCGLGGGTGTGSAPVIAEIAKKDNALTIAVVSLPFTEEGIMRWDNAQAGLEKLRDNTDTVIIVQNDRLLDIAPDMPLNQAFKVADEILANAVKGITELVTEKGLVNLDFADIRAVMKDGGTAMIGLGESSAEDKAIHSVEMAVQNPLLDIDISGAKSALINITGGNDMSLKDARVIMKSVAERLDPSARVIWGARMDPNLENTLRVMLIVTGLVSDGKRTAYRKFTDEPLKDDHTDTLNQLEDNDMESVTTVMHVSGNGGSHEAKESTPDGSQHVFYKIFGEEAEVDIGILQDAANALQVGLNANTPLRDIKNASNSIHSTAQLFAFDHITKLSKAVETMATYLHSQELELTDDTIRILQSAGNAFHSMIHDDESADIDMQQIVENINRMIHAGVSEDHQELQSEEMHSTSTPDWEQEGESKSIVSVSNESVGARKKKVGDMVDYVRNLLNEEQ